MNQYTPNVYFRQYPISKLISTQKYQRSISDTWVSGKIKEFDVNKINVVKVSNRDGQLFIMDGQNTVALIRAVSGSDDTPVWCMVYDNLEYENEAEMFAYQKRAQRAIHVIDEFNAKIEARDETALDIKDVLDTLGLTVSNASKGFNISCIKELESTYASIGKEGLWRALMLITRTWNGESGSYCQGIVKGVTKLLKTYPGRDFSDSRFKDALSRVDPVQITREAAGMSFSYAVNFAIVMATAYNKRLVKNKLDISLIR